jgi:hypothetical protein
MTDDWSPKDQGIEGWNFKLHFTLRKEEGRAGD